MKMKIPPENQDAFDRLMRPMPPQFKNDDNFQKTALTYLILGGESLARHYIDVSRLDFPGVSLLLQNTPLIEPDREINEDAQGDDEDDDNEDDIDNED